MQRPTGIILLLVASAAMLSASLVQPSAGRSEHVESSDGVVSARSAYGHKETVDRLKQDVVAKGIMMFAEINQSELAAAAGIMLRPSTLLVFGNPPLGVQFITAKPQAGLDWPVRLLVHEDESGQVWTTYTDFAWIAQRHRITNREAAFTMASNVIASITSSVTKR